MSLKSEVKLLGRTVHDCTYYYSEELLSDGSSWINYCLCLSVSEEETYNLWAPADVEQNIISNSAIQMETVSFHMKADSLPRRRR